MENNQTYSESIFQKRIRRFKSIKRGYYSFLILLLLYILSNLSPLLVNGKALIVKYANGQYDQGEHYIDENQNNKCYILKPSNSLIFWDYQITTK